MTESVPTHALVQTRLAPEGPLEHFFAEEVESYLSLVAALPQGTPDGDVRALDDLLRAALRELRTLQAARLEAGQGGGSQGALIPAA